MSEENFLAEESADQLFARLQFMSIKPSKILVLGVSKKYSAGLLKKQYPEAEIITEESAMLALPAHSVELVFANLFLPFSDNFQKNFSDWHQLLRPESLVMFSTFGPDTLKEIAENHALHLVDMHNIGDALTKNHFADPVLDVEMVTVTYREKEKLIHELRHLKLISETSRDLAVTKDSENLFALTFEMIYGHAWAAEKGYQADESGVVKIPLSHLRK